ncbi:MAG: hypothetical protein AAF351_13285 [Pseudomonadota bacterium]
MWPRVITLSAAIIALIALMFYAMQRAHAPWLIAPPNGTIQPHTDPVEFKWRYGGFVYTSFVRWRTPEHFVVCVKEFAPGDFPCSYPQGQELGVWARPVADFPSESGAPNTSLAEVIKHYWLELDQLPPELQGKDLMWTVAACASSAPDSCSYAVPAWRFQTGPAQLTATTALVRYVGGTNVTFESVIQNSGPSRLGTVDVRLQVAQLRLDGSNRAVDNLNTPGLDYEVDRVFLKDGRIMTIKALLDAGGSQADVKGILVKNGYEAAFDHTFNNGLDAGEFGYFNSMPVSIPQFTGQPSGSRVGLFLEVIVDPDQRITEANEDHQDNTAQDRYVYTIP